MAFLPPASAEAGVLSALALDALAHPLLLLRADSTLLHANPAGQHALAPGGAWQRGSHGHVHPRDASLKPTFMAALQAAAAGKTQALNAVASTAATATISTIATIQPLITSSGAVAALLLALPLPAHGAADVQAFAHRHSLTDAETRVLEQLLQGRSAARAAQAVGVSVSTVRSQVLSLRRKTGHASVSALLAALRGLPALIHNG